jgi:hypothetical protein
VKLKLITTLITLIYASFSSADNYDERSLGGLFTSPSERQKIDNDKRGDIPQSASRRLAPSSVRINGALIRSKGKNSVWINGTKATGNEVVGGVKVFSKSANKDNLTIPVLVDGKSVRIKPGQSWSEETGSVVDNY